MLNFCRTVTCAWLLLSVPALFADEIPAELPTPAAESPAADQPTAPESPATETPPSSDQPAASEAKPVEPASPAAEPGEAAGESATSAPPQEAATPGAEAGKKYELVYKFKAGDVVRTEIVHRAAVQTTIDGSTQKAETQSKSVKLWRVEDVTPAGNVKFVHMVESIDMWHRDQGRKEVRYNSQTDSKVPPGYEEVAAAVGKPLTVVTMDAHGKILKREEKRAHPVAASTQMTIPLPAEPVAVGETWNTPLDIDVTLTEGGTKKIHTRQKFTLEKVSNDVATIAVDSQILTPIHDPSIEAQLIQRLSTGSVKFDIAKGRVISQQLDLDRHVIGFSGAASSMHYVTRFTEELLPATEQTARAPAAKPANAKAAAKPAATKSTAPAGAKPTATAPQTVPRAAAKPAPARQPAKR